MLPDAGLNAGLDLIGLGSLSGREGLVKLSKGFLASRQHTSLHLSSRFRQLTDLSGIVGLHGGDHGLAVLLELSAQRCVDLFGCLKKSLGLFPLGGRQCQSVAIT